MATNQAAQYQHNFEESLKKSDEYVIDMLSNYENGYIDGWEAKGEEDKKNFRAKVKGKVAMTMGYIVEIANSLFKADIDLLSAHVKIKSPNSQTVLLVIGIDDYLSDKLLAIYQLTNSIERKSHSEEYGVAFSFTYDEGNFNISTVEAHGFVTTYSKNG